MTPAADRFELALDDEQYPCLLRESPRPPRMLYGVGDPSCLIPGVGIVGARKATPYGLAAARILAGWSGGAGYVVVSGGALGCDQAAHCAALEAGGRTIAVMPGGADIVYPKRSSELLRRIALSGAVVSEHPWGTQPTRWMFRTRNRVIAGLTRVLLVLEASLPSGTFTTAEYALDAGRTVAVVPGSIFAPECLGTNRLLRNGAIPITDASDLRALLESELWDTPIRLVPWAGPDSKHDDDPLLSALRVDPKRPDDIARLLGMDIVTVARRLGELEARGELSRYPDGRYGPC